MPTLRLRFKSPLPSLYIQLWLRLCLNRYRSIRGVNTKQLPRRCTALPISSASCAGACANLRYNIITFCMVPSGHSATYISFAFAEAGAVKCTGFQRNIDLFANPTMKTTFIHRLIQFNCFFLVCLISTSPTTLSLCIFLQPAKTKSITCVAVVVLETENYKCEKVAFRFSANAAIPSFWSAVPNMVWKSRRSRRRPSFKGRLFATGEGTPEWLATKGCVVGQEVRHTGIHGFFSCLYGNSSVPGDQGGDLDSLGDTFLSITLNKPTDKTDSFCFVGLDLATGKNDIHRSCFSNQVGQSLCPSGTREDTECDFWLAKRRCRRGDEDVAHHGEFAAASELWYQRLSRGLGEEGIRENVPHNR